MVSNTKEVHRGSITYLAERRAEIAKQVLPLYAQGKGHKTIAKEVGCSPRIARTILIEAGVYKPGALRALSSTSPHVRDAWRSEHAAQLKAQRAYEQAWAHQFRNKRQPRKWATWMEQYRNDEEFRTRHILRKRVRNMVTRGQETPLIIALVGCTREHFVQHLERHFLPGMTWDNYGVGHGKWTLDHSRPCTAYQLTDPQQARRCFHWSNTKPMWWIDNVRKGNKVAA